MTSNFKQQIVAFNLMYRLPAYGTPRISMFDFSDELALIERLTKFKSILAEELEEVEDLIKTIQQGASEVEILTELADWLGDLQVYCASEMAKFGLNNEVVLDIIMHSNMSKLGTDGMPIYDERGKVMKGPGYWRPEPMIRHYIERTRQETKGE